MKEILREARPEWSAVPENIIRKIEEIVGEKISTGNIAWGGYSNSACFEITLFSGRKLFVKGTHPGQDAHGTKTVEQEVFAYKNIEALKEMSPTLLGTVNDGDEDGWSLIVFDHVKTTDKTIWDDELIRKIFLVLKKIHKVSKKPEGTTQAEETNYIERYFKPCGGWIRISEEKNTYEKFLSIFSDKNEAEFFFKKALPILAEKQKEFCEEKKLVRGIIHQDLRVDNFLITENKIYIVDWPNVCFGSVELDLAQFLPSLESSSGKEVSELLATYEKETTIVFDRENILRAFCSFSGHLADSAYRKIPEKLPRLRQMQKDLLFYSLKYIAKELNLGKIPQINQ